MVTTGLRVKDHKLIQEKLLIYLFTLPQLLTNPAKNCKKLFTPPRKLIKHRVYFVVVTVCVYYWLRS